MNNAIPILSIIIVNYKVNTELYNCINSIYKSKPRNSFEIVVVDNDASKKNKDDLKRKYPSVSYVGNDRNVGYGEANNIGSNLARGKYLFVLNPDTIFLNNVIDSIVDFIKKNSKAGAVAPILVDKSNKPFSLQGSKELTPLRAVLALSFLSKILPDKFIHKSYYYSNWDMKEVKEMDVVPGTAFVIRKTLFNEIGKFDNNYFLYFEESDLCRRLIKKGYVNYITPMAAIYHACGRSTKKFSFAEKEFKKSRRYYFKKNYGQIMSSVVEIILNINRNSLFSKIKLK